jgi:RNA polymerase sigma-70 factor (ECF subfamily)
MHNDYSKPRNDASPECLLIERIQAREAGWEDLFGMLVARHQTALYGRCLAYLKNHDDAADASQETLFRAYRAIGSFKGDAAFRTWLFAIADNQCHTLARKRARHVIDENIEAMLQLHRGAETATAETMGEAAAMRRDLVHEALQQITPLGRDVLQLRYFAELSIEDIAATLGVGISATKMRLYRAQDQVAGLIQPPALDYAV